MIMKLSRFFSHHWTAATAVALSILAAGCTRSEPPMPAEISLSYCLGRLSDQATFERTPIAHQHMISTFDRSGGNNDWADLSQLKPGDLYVLADLSGPGCVNRIWMTTVPAAEWLFFFDGEKTPRIRTKADELFGKSPPFLPPLCDMVSNGNYFYMPLPFSKSLKICVTIKPESAGARPYFQINYETYSAGTRVKSFSPELSQDEVAALERARSVWTNVGSAAWQAKETCSVRTNTQLSARQTWCWLNTTKPGRLTTFWIRPIPPQNLSFYGRSQLLRALVLRLYWDGEKQPSVVAPLGDFFCNGLRANEFASFPLALTGGVYVCRFPMSFKGGVRAEIQNLSYVPMAIEAGYNVQALEESASPSYFHAHWNQAVGSGIPYRVLNAEGPGHLAGCYLISIGMDGSWNIFEGDDMLFIDGETKASFNGTGLEDYFNGAWYYGNMFNLPLHGLLTKSPIRSSQYRFHLADAVRFDKGLVFDFQFGDANAARGYMSSVAYWYQPKPHPVADNMPQLQNMFPPPDPLEQTAMMGALFLQERVDALETAANMCFEYAEKYAGHPWCPAFKLRGWAYREAIDGYPAVSNIYREVAETSTDPALAVQARLLSWFHLSPTNALLGIHPIDRHKVYLDGQLIADVDDPPVCYAFPVGLAPGQHEITVELSSTRPHGQLSVYLRAHGTNICTDGSWEYRRGRPSTWPRSDENDPAWKPVEESNIGVPCMAHWQFAPNPFIFMQSRQNMVRPWSTWLGTSEVAYLRKRFVIETPK